MSKRAILYIRHSVQTLSVLLLVYIIWMTREPLSGVINPKIYFQIDPLIMLVTAIAERVLLAGILLAGATIILTFILGRAFCGWVCPLGALMDLCAQFLSLFRRKSPHEAEPSRARKIKYILLGIIALFAVIGIQLAWIIDPITIFVRSFSFTVHPLITNSFDWFFMALLRALEFPVWLEEIYYLSKETVLAAKNPVFPHTWLIFSEFALIFGLVLLKRRFWCRYICPLGAMLALPAKFSPLRRIVRSCKDKCLICKDICRMNAIFEDNSYIPQECILCMDCITECPNQSAAFTFKRKSRPQLESSNVTMAVDTGPTSLSSSMTRARFLAILLGSITFIMGLKHKVWCTISGASPRKSTRPVVRPPAALKEDEFVQRCIRCGNCMKVCVTNVLQPVLLESGFQGIWTPHLCNDIGYCEYKCTLCGRVCPTGAIEPLTIQKKMQTKMGTAVVNKDTCRVWSVGVECLVCEEHCPVSNKAIKTQQVKTGHKILLAPCVSHELCVGCGS